MDELNPPDTKSLLLSRFCRVIGYRLKAPETLELNMLLALIYFFNVLCLNHKKVNICNPKGLLTSPGIICLFFERLQLGK